MRARVTNLSRGARGFHTAAGGTALLDPGAASLLALAPHPAHDAWGAAGEVVVAPEGEPEPAPSGGSGARGRGTVARRA